LFPVPCSPGVVHPESSFSPPCWRVNVTAYSSGCGLHTQIERSPAPVHLIGSCWQNPVFALISTPKRTGAGRKQESANRAGPELLRCLRHNVPLNVNHDVPRYFSGEAPFADGNNIGLEDCQQISMQILRHLHQPVRYSRA